MASIEFTRSAPFGAITIHRAITAVQTSVEGLVAWEKSRRTQKALNALSDEVLADIGLTRGDIAKF